MPLGIPSPIDCVAGQACNRERADLPSKDSTVSSPTCRTGTSLSEGAKIGIGVGVGVGGILLIAALIVLLICCIKRRKRRKNAVNSLGVDNSTVQTPNTATNSPVTVDSIIMKGLSDDVTYDNTTNPLPAPSSNNIDYDEALPVNSNHARNIAREKYENVSTVIGPNDPSSSVFTITDNAIYRTVANENIVSEGNSSYSLERYVDNGLISNKTADISNGFIIVENDLYH